MATTPINSPRETQQQNHGHWGRRTPTRSINLNPAQTVIALFAALMVAVLGTAVWTNTKSVGEETLREAFISARIDANAQAPRLAIPGGIRCEAGDVLFAPIAGPRTGRFDVTVIANDSSIAEARLSPRGKALRVDCLDEGDTTITLESPSGATAVVPLRVTPSLDEVAVGEASVS